MNATTSDSRGLVSALGKSDKGLDCWWKRAVEAEGKLKVAVELIEMVQDNSKMPHKHEDYYLRLCCLSERAREALKEIKGEE